MMALSLVRLVPRPGKIVGGRVLLDGEDLLQKTEREMRAVRGKKISMILQDPMVSLDPVFTVGNQLTEVIRLHQGIQGRSAQRKAAELLHQVRIPDPEVRLGEYPHQLSGGLRQRVVSAIALACEPRVMIADEPTSSLDATIQLQYLQLLKEIQARTGVAILLITHDFGVVARMCDRVAVMYAGRIVECAEVRQLFRHPRHPYTASLISAVPRPGQWAERLLTIDGQPPALYALPPGCPFAPRCPRVEARCRAEYPPDVEVADGHRVSCWRSMDA